MVIIRCPFRISLGGGGTDLPSYYQNFGGYVLTAAINRYMYVMINEPSTSDKIKLYYAKTEVTEDVAKIEHDIIRESLKYFGINKPMEIASMADIESGTGMGSSSSFTVALLAGLNLLQRKVISPSILAEEACTIEIDKVGKKIGKQDQYIAAHGGIQELNISQQGIIGVLPLNLTREFICELESRMLLFYTGIRRPAALILDRQSDSLKVKNKKMLRIMHEIKAIGVRVRDSLVAEDIDLMGKLFNDHWQLKRQVSVDMSNRWLDEVYDDAMCEGSLGGKIVGAGGGGFLLLICKEGMRKKLIRRMALKSLQFVDFRFDFEGVKIISL